MTRTEERLIDALGAVGRSVGEQNLPPLPARSPATGPSRWGRWLAPLAAAASVVLVVATVTAVHLFSGRPTGGAGIGPPPRYYVTEESAGIQVRDTATGAVTARLPRPFSAPGYFGMYANVVAAGDGDREFVAEYTGTPAHGTVVQTRLYSFHVTGAGRVAGLALVKGGQLSHFIGGTALAVSPDGSQVATVVYHTVGRHSPRPVPQIMVINLRTGAHSLWAGGLQRGGLYLSISSISWGPGGGFLVFLGQWCHGWLREICGTGPHFSQVRTLRVAPGGGRLSDGSALLSQSARYGYLAQALLSPDGRALTVVALGRPHLAPGHSVSQNLRVVRIPLRGAGGARLLYRGVLGPAHPAVSLSSDASGRHLLLAWERNGWIDHGRLRLLPPQGGAAFTDAW
jgi:hypothetical protein